MTRNHKLYFKYLYFNLPHFYLYQTKKGFHNNTIVIPKLLLYYTSLHFRFSSIYYLTQLVDMFAYELPTENTGSLANPRVSESYVVYNFHNLVFQDRFFLFCVDSLGSKFGNFVNSIAEVFPNSSWLEREVSELHGVAFTNKKDLRNLMLQYGDTTVPFQKSSPSIGYKEIYYDSVSDILIETPITLQA